MKLTNNLHVSVAGDGGEGRGLGADLTPVPAGALLRQLRQLDLPRVRVVVVDDDAGAHVVGDRVLATWQVSRRKSGLKLGMTLVSELLHFKYKQ